MVMVLFAYWQCVNDAAALGKQMRLQNLRAEALLCLPFTEYVDLPYLGRCHGNGPPPRTLRCHNSPIV